ncbi:MAG TPA: diguanylate cyclase [Solirubrobacteraceae bacterium]|nr:diguanylate cyclase [Solirubrobacteraceae bacterium]
MTGWDDRGIVDQSALRMRVATFAAGIWLSYVVVGASTLYIALTWGRPHRLLITLLYGSGLLGAVVISRLPRERIVRSRYREVFFMAWSLLDLALIVAACAADGGARSPMALVLFVPVVFAAMSYPLASVVTVGGLSVLSYLALAATTEGGSTSYEALFASMLFCTGAMSAWQARNHDHQHRALMEVSRADPLTGCLNRRGFEERAIAEIASATRRAQQGAVLVLDVDHFKEVNDQLGHGAGDELLRWVVATLREALRPPDAIGRIGGDEFAVLLADVEPGEAVATSVRLAGLLNRRQPCSIGVASFPMDGIDLEELMRAADARLYASREGRPEAGAASPDERLSWAAALARAVDLRMSAEHEHSKAVAEWSVRIASALGWHPEMLGTLRIAAMLHDVGKVTVPDRILGKPGPLSDGEWEIVRGHSMAGAELIARVAGLGMIVPWIRHSHESFDGSGYPDGLAGEAIPQASRIMLVADAFDAMTNARSYRPARSVEQARDELVACAGSQFDPTCVEVMVGLLGDLGRSDAGARAGAVESIV